MLNLGVKLAVDGANVQIHSVVLERYFRMTEAGIMNSHELRFEGPLNETLLWGATIEPPVWLFMDDTRQFWSPTTWVPLDYVSGLAVDVKFSFDGVNIMSKRVRWDGIKDEDYKFHGTDSRREARAFDDSGGYSVYDPRQAKS